MSQVIDVTAIEATSLVVDVAVEELVPVAVDVVTLVPVTIDIIDNVGPAGRKQKCRASGAKYADVGD